MRRSLFPFFVALCAMSTQGCMSFVSSTFYIPNNRFISPESSGGFGDGTLSLGFGKETAVILTDPMASDDQDIINSSKVKTGEGIHLEATAGLHKKVDFIFYNGATGLKFQALGNPASEAKSENISLSFGVSVDRGSSDSTSYKTKSSIEYSGVDAMVLSGYRIKDNHLLYANLASSNFSSKGSVTKESRNETGTTTSRILKGPKRVIRETSLLLGWQGFSHQAYLMFETGYTIASLEGKNTTRGLALGGTLGVRW